MSRQLIWFAFLLSLVLVPASLHAQSAALIGPDTYPAGINPLTGLPVDNPDVLNRRPLMIKVINAPASIRPQNGLMAADLVWEHLLSGGVTRFSAIYLSQDPDHVGPIRSLRLVDFELTRIYRTITVYSGMAQGTLDVLHKDNFMTRHAFGGVSPCPALCRFPEPGKPLEHTLYADIGALRKQAVVENRDTTPDPVYGMAFSQSVPVGGTVLSSITIDYRQTSVEWDYNATTGRWLRSQDGAPHFDKTTNTQISAANVAIIEDDHIEQPVVSPGYWGPENYAFAVNLIGSGRMILFRDGQYFEGEWRRANREDPLTYFDTQGNILPFKPGNTFINLVPRWQDGYQLRFLLANPVIGSVTTSGVNLRKGPGSGYAAGGVVSAGDTLYAVGRNSSGTWVQVLVNGDVRWIAVEYVSFGSDNVMRLPLVRSTFEH